MDLQAILDSTDSDDDDDLLGSNNNSNNNNVDLERILREEDGIYDSHDDDDDEDRNDITITSLCSTIETTPHYLAPMNNNKRSNNNNTMRYVDDATPEKDHGLLSMKQQQQQQQYGSHNAEDWAVLQQILGEDDEDDLLHHDKTTTTAAATSSWVNTVRSEAEARTDVDAILESMDDDDDDDDDFAFRASFVATMTRGSTTPIEELLKGPYTPTAGGTTTTHSDMEVLSPMTNGYSLSEEEAGHSMSADSSDLLYNQQQQPTTRVRAGDFASNVDEETASKNALLQAQAYERKLLKPGHREIVSPLMVKRRLKPRIEMESLMQKKQQQHGIKGHNKLSKSTSTTGPRYRFSGMLEDKPMPSMSKHLLKNSTELLTKKGLPTALSVNSKFIAVGTQKGYILVFDLFEVLRQELNLHGHHHHQQRVGGEPSSSTAAFNAAHQGGSVTSIDVSGNGEALIAGYARGLLVLWDVIKGMALKVMNDIHPSPITNVRFLNEREMKVVTVDAGGLVNKLNFTKNILWSAYSMETECLLDGTAGQILAMHVLPSPSSTINKKSTTTTAHPLMRRLILIALSSERSSFAVAVEPTINVLHRWSRPTPEQIMPPDLDLNISSDHVFLPCLAWGWSLVLGGGNVVTPILARSWGCQVQLLRANFPEIDASVDAQQQQQWPAFGLHDEFNAPAPVVALEWLGERSLAFLTITNEFTVVDTVMMTLLERLTFSPIRLVFAEFALSRTVGGDGVGNKKRLCTTFQNSMRSSDDRLLVLCQDEIRSISILGAKRRISALEEDGEWLEALAVALDHYESTVKSQEDRQRDPTGNKDITKHPEFYSVTRTEDEEWIAKLLIRYFNIAVDNAPESSSTFSQGSANSIPGLDLAHSHFQMLAGVCVEFCVMIRRLDLLFGPIFRRFLSVGHATVFLDVLEPYILNDKLNYIAPETMSHFVEHCKTTNGIAVVERCLLHMDVTIMDFDSIIGLLKRNEMFSALFHVFTHGLDDFVSPLETIMERLFDLADEGEATGKRRVDGAPQNSFQRFGYKTIIYLQHIFSGKSFPQDTSLQPEEKLHVVRPQLLRFLQQRKHLPPGGSRKALDGVGYRALSYPYAHLLLMVDPRAMLDTFCLALDAPDSEFSNYGDGGFESIGGWEVEVGGEIGSNRGSRDETDERTSGGGPDRQQIISMLSSIILPDEDNQREIHDVSRSKTAVNSFLDFMAVYLTKGVVRANKTVTYLIISRMSDKYVSASEEDRPAAQKRIIELLTALPRNAYEPDHALEMIENAGIHRAALLLHQQGAAAWHEGGEGEDRRSHHFKSAIDCYLEDSDPSFRTEVFDYAKNECAGASSEEDSDARKLKKALLSRLSDLVTLDPILSTKLVAELYIDDLDDVVNFLGEDKDGLSQFMFLHAIISGDLAKLDVVAGSVLGANLSMNHHQSYLSLMAKLHPDMVYDYLSKHDNYRPEECLKLCQQYDIADASAYLLERMGNVTSALQLILQTFESRIMNLKRTVRGAGNDMFSRSSSRRYLLDWKKSDPRDSEQQQKQAKDVEGVKKILVVALDLCERNSGVKASRSAQGSQLWFNVLDRLINAKGFLRLSKEKPAHAEIIAGVLSDLLQTTMQRMVSSVPLSDLVRKVTDENSGSRLGEVREMVMSLLKTYGHETNVASSAVKVIHYDLQKMDVTSYRSKISGSSVHSVMQQSLRSSSRRTSPFAAALHGTTLRLGDNRDATLDDGSYGQRRYGQKSGLSQALHRLQRRSACTIDKGNDATTPVTSGSTVSMLSVEELSFYKGETQLYGERYVGELGEAQSYGSLHWIQS